MGAKDSLVDDQVEAILIEHQRHRGGCLCGWNELGMSHPGHQTEILRREGLLINDDEGVTRGTRRDQ